MEHADDAHGQRPNRHPLSVLVSVSSDALVKLKGEVYPPPPSPIPTYPYAKLHKLCSTSIAVISARSWHLKRIIC